MCSHVEYGSLVITWFVSFTLALGYEDCYWCWSFLCSWLLSSVKCLGLGEGIAGSSSSSTSSLPCSLLLDVLAYSFLNGIDLCDGVGVGISLYGYGSLVMVALHTGLFSRLLCSSSLLVWIRPLAHGGALTSQGL